MRKVNAMPTPLVTFLLLLPLVAGCATPSQIMLDAEVKRLCAIDGGVKVYETVRLPPEKFNQYGQINIANRKDAAPRDDFYYEWDVTYIKQKNVVTDLSRSHFKIYRVSDSKLLGESIAYTRRGGDMPGPWHPSHLTCPSDSGLNTLQKNIFTINGDTK